MSLRYKLKASPFQFKHCSCGSNISLFMSKLARMLTEEQPPN